MPGRRLLGAAVLAALLVRMAGSTQAAPSRATYQIALIRHDNVPVFRRPQARGHALAMLVQQSQVEVVRVAGAWAQVQIWNSVRGWVRKVELFYGGPWHSVSTYRAPTIRHAVQAHAPAALHVSAVATAALELQSTPGGTVKGHLAAGAFATISAWQQDAAGTVWYRVGKAWARADALRFRLPDPGAAHVNGHPLSSLVAGKGMWLTLGAFATGDPSALARAAQRDGITHLYLEAAISPLGFHGRDAVGRMIEAGHARHLTVIAWVYPYLYDVAADVDLTRQVAAFRSASGQRFDGIAADLETNVTAAGVRTYSQLVRSTVGPNYLLVGVTYPPQSFAGYPFADVARSYNVIAPMDYWHETETANGLDYGHMRYGFEYASRYARDSVLAIRRIVGNVPVTPIGQAFDDFGRLEMGPYAPSAAEVQGFLAGSKSSGAPGASFFQWMTVTDAEWRAISDFRY